MTTEGAIREKFRALDALLDEHTRRVWAATEANTLGYGGISLVARAMGVSRRAIAMGLREITEGDRVPEGFLTQMYARFWNDLADHASA